MRERSAILLVGETALCAALGEQLASAGAFSCAIAHGAPEALRRLREAPPDALLIDAAHVEAESVGATPALLQAARGARCSALLIGGDPALARGNARLATPLRFTELLARVETLCAEPPAPGFDIGPFRFDAATLSLLRGGEAIALTEKEAAILLRLAQNPTEPTPREHLLRDVWGYNAGVDSRTVETHVHRLRRKLESDPADPRLLLTEGGGYRIAELAETDAPWAATNSKS